MALDQTRELVAHAHEPGGDPAVKLWQAQPMAELEEVGRLVGDDHGSARLSDPRHLAKRGLGRVEMIEAAIAQHGVELRGRGTACPRPRREPAGGRGPRCGAGRPRAGWRNVDADDRPVLGKPARVDAVANGDVEQA